MLKGALWILLHQTDLYHFIQNRYLQKETLISKLLSYILELAENSSTFSSLFTRTANYIMWEIISGQAQKLTNAYIWIQLCTHEKSISTCANFILIQKTLAK